MRTSAVAFAAPLLLLLLATRAHGIRLDRQLNEAINSKQQMADPKSGDGEASVSDDTVMRHCTPDGRCSGAFGAGAKVKKALAHADETAEAKQQQVGSTGNGNSTTVDVEATQQAGRHGDEAAASHGSQDASAASTRVARQRTYPDLMDIAGMDYSPATRKPPIHN